MLSINPTFAIGYHGCDATEKDALLTDPSAIKVSQSPFEWLGHGMYFWENDYGRALRWAEEKKRRGTIENPVVIGAIIQFGYCCNLIENTFIDMLARYFSLMKERYVKKGIELPVNKDTPHDLYKDKVLRNRDCAVFEFMHDQMFEDVQRDVQMKGYSNQKVFDSVRAFFPEGGEAYEGSALHALSHVQICVRNPNCIRAFFHPRESAMAWLEQNN